MTGDIIKTGILITHVSSHEGMTKMRGIQLGRRTYAGKSWHQWHGAARTERPSELAGMGTHITRSAYQSLSPSAKAEFEKRGVKVIEKERMVRYDVPYQEETRMAYGVLKSGISPAEYQQDPMRYSPYAKKKRRDAVRERAGEISSIPGAPDKPGEARAKMIAAGVMTSEGKYKEIAGYYVDPVTGKKQFVAKGEPIPTFVKEPEVKSEIPPEMRDKVIQEPFRATGLEPEYLMRKDEYTSGTQYEPTAFEPPKPIEVREPGYFERKLQEYDIAVSKVIPSLKYYEELGVPYREKYKWKQPEITKVPVAFGKAAYTEIEEKPVTTAAKTAAFIALTKGIGYGIGLVKGIPAIGKPIAEKAIPVALTGVGAAYGAGVVKRVTAPEVTILQREIAGAPLITEERIERERTKTEKAAIAGKIFAGEILPMSVGGAIGVKSLPKVKISKPPKEVPVTIKREPKPFKYTKEIKEIEQMAWKPPSKEPVIKWKKTKTPPKKSPEMRKKVIQEPLVDIGKPVVPVIIKRVSKSPKDVFTQAQTRFMKDISVKGETQIRGQQQILKHRQLLEQKPVQTQKQIQKQIQKQQILYRPIQKIKDMERVETRQSRIQKMDLKQHTKEIEKQKQRILYTQIQKITPSFQLERIQLQRELQIQEQTHLQKQKEVILPKELQITKTKLKRPPEQVPKIVKPLKKPRKRVIRKKKRLTKAQRYQIRNPSAAVDDFMVRTVSTEIFTGQPEKKSKKKSRKEKK